MPRTRAVASRTEVLAPILAAADFPWDLPRVEEADFEDWQQRVDALARRRPYVKARVKELTDASASLARLDWTTLPAPKLGAVIEAFFRAHRAADAFFPFADVDPRSRRSAWTAWWLLRAWETGAAPELMLRLLVAAFEGGPRALEELYRRASANVGSFYTGVLKLLTHHGDDVEELLRTVRKFAWKRVPAQLRDPGRFEHEEVLALLDEAAWELVTERFGRLDPLEAAVRGLDGEFWRLPGVIGNALRRRDLLAEPPRDFEVVLERQPSDELSPLGEALYSEARRQVEATASDPATLALTTPIEQRDLARALGVNEATVSRHVEKVRRGLLHRIREQH